MIFGLNWRLRGTRSGEVQVGSRVGVLGEVYRLQVEGVGGGQRGV